MLWLCAYRKRAVRHRHRIRRTKVSFFNHWSEALKPKQAAAHAPHPGQTAPSEATPAKFRKLSVHRFGNHLSIYAHDPSGQVKVYYREIAQR